MGARKMQESADGTHGSGTAVPEDARTDGWNGDGREFSFLGENQAVLDGGHEFIGFACHQSRDEVSLTQGELPKEKDDPPFLPPAHVGPTAWMT